MARRLLTYICIDTSGSMKGEPIEAVNVGLQSLLSALRQNPYALESVYLSISTFDTQIKNVLPLTALEDVVLPMISCPDSGATFLGKMLEEIAQMVKKDRILATTFAYEQSIPQIKSLNFGNIVACAAGPKADPNILKKLTDTVVSLDTMDANSFAQFFQWVSASVAQTSVSVGAVNHNDLPPPPDEINIVF